MVTGVGMTDIYTEVPLGIPNVFGKKKFADNDKVVMIDKRITAFVTALATKRPDWKLVGYSPFRNNDKLEFHKFKVMSNREVVGEISTEWRGGEWSYTCTNERIRNSRKRGSVIRSKDVKKAVKVATTFFREKSVEELMSDARVSAATLLGAKASSDYAMYDACYTRVSRALGDYIMDNFSTLKQFAINGGATLEDTDNLLPLFEQVSITTEMERWESTGKGSIVLIRGNEYIIQESATKVTNMFTADTLPSHIKRGLGMLKLVDDRKLISRVGIRLGANTFFIGPETAHE